MGVINMSFNSNKNVNAIHVEPDDTFQFLNLPIHILSQTPNMHNP